MIENIGLHGRIGGRSEIDLSRKPDDLCRVFQ